MQKKKMLKIVLWVLLVLILLYGIYILRNYIILNKLSKLAKETINNDNYYAQLLAFQGDDVVSIVESYNKDSKYLSIVNFYGPKKQNKQSLTVYKDNTEKMGVIQSGDRRVALLNGESIVPGEITIRDVFSEVPATLDKIKFSAISLIKSEQCNLRDCYLIELKDGWRMWIDKETGLIIREINGGFITNRKYTFDIVKDEDISKPDITGCEIAD